MEYDFQSAFQPVTPPYTDSSSAEFDEAISSLLDQSPNGTSELGETAELQGWLETQPIFNAYDDPLQSLQSLQANLIGNSVGVDPRRELMLSGEQDLQGVQFAYPEQPYPENHLAEDIKPKAKRKAKDKASENGTVTKKQKSEAQKQRFPKPPQPVPPPPRQGGPKNPSHNAVERRYRNNINTRMLALRCAVPALVAQPPQTSSRRKAPPLYVEGVAVPGKINKQTVLIGATEYIRRLRGREQRLMREVELLRSQLPMAEQTAWAYNWGAVDDRDLYDEVDDFDPPDNAFVDLVDEPDTKTSTEDLQSQESQESQDSQSSEGGNAPRYLLGMFLSFSLLQKPYTKQQQWQHQNMFRRSFEEGHVVSSSLPSSAVAGGAADEIDWKDHLIPDLLHPHFHDIIQTVLICLTLFVLLYPLLPSLKRNPVTQAAQIGWMTIQRLLKSSLGVSCGKFTEETIQRAQKQIYKPKEHSKMDRLHTHMLLSTSPGMRESPVALATAALHTKSSKLWKEAQDMYLESEPRYVQLALERDIEDAHQLCTMGASNKKADLNVLQKISSSVSVLALEELWSLIFTQMVQEKASVGDVQLINKAVGQLVSSTRNLPTVDTMSMLSAAMWALLQGKKESALRLAAQLSGRTASLKCLKVFRMLTKTSENLDDVDGKDDMFDSQIDEEIERCDDLATIAMLYLSLKMSLPGNKGKGQGKALYRLTLRLRSLLGSLDERKGKLIDDETYDAAVDSLQVIGYQVIGMRMSAIGETCHGIGIRNWGHVTRMDSQDS